MDLISEYNQRWTIFTDIIGVAIKVYNNYRPGLMESAYEAALKYLLEHEGHNVERQVFVPIYWNDVLLDQNYRLDLLVDGNLILELKAVKYIGQEHRRQLKSYMHITHKPYGMLINFSDERLYSEWYYRNPKSDVIERIKLVQ